MKKKSNRILNYIKILSKKEKLALYLSIAFFSIGLVSWSIFYYFDATKKAPAMGGEYTEGIVGKPTYINPLLSRTNEVDGIISSLIFSSLLKYDKDSNLVNDLAESYEISDDKKTYTVKVRPDVKWHDNNRVTAGDVFFTAKLIQDPKFKSTLRGEWQDIRIELIDENTIKFILEKPYSPFLNKLTFGILPQHIFKDITPENFLINELNLKPVGSGPFEFAEFKKDKQENIISYQLLANDDYRDRAPYLKKINFNFYGSEDELIEAYNKKEINGFGLFSYDKIQQFENNEDTAVRTLKSPRYFATFFNQTKSVPLSEKKIREALSYAINREAIIEQVFYSKAASSLNSLILPDFGEIKPSSETEKYNYNPEKAKELLKEDDWKQQEDGSWKKDEEELQISLISTQWPALIRTSELIKKQWEEIGIKVSVSNLELSNIQQNFIKPREYQVLLFGQEYFGNDPDPYHFWHSSEKHDPGNNIAVFGDDKLDELLGQVRESHALEEKEAKYHEIEKILANEIPAHYLFNVNYIYIMNQRIKGFETNSIVNPIFKFNDIVNWHINTKRVKK
ncbi:MAG: peptide ABC transporter substrate-binding protein [Candidatus Moranbacteria bacterium]|nr:peptide ABC transporter substrate-binding protein [Candidatus Moranbacteria bacterium]